jgi:hypothetical protein
MRKSGGLGLKGQKEVLKTSESNNSQVNQIAPDNFKEDVVSKMKADIQQSIDDGLSKTSQDLKISKDQMIDNNKKLEDEVRAKNKQSATGVLVDAWVKPKN